MGDEKTETKPLGPVEPHVPREIVRLVREIRMELAPDERIDRDEAVLYTRRILDRILDTWMPLPDDGEIEEDEESA